MSIETKSTHITLVGENIFADLGFAPEEAAMLLADSRRIISKKLAQNERKGARRRNYKRNELLTETEPKALPPKADA